MIGAPVGTLILATSSRWMNGDLFLEVMKHFVEATNSWQTYRALLIFNNHESHLTPAVVSYAKEHSIEVLTLPPHYNSTLQLLDVTVYRSLELFYYRALNTWLFTHSHIASLFNEAFV